MEKIIVNHNDVDKRIDNFISKYYDGLAKTFIFKLFRTNKVKVNGKKVKHDYRLNLYDEINIYYDLSNKDKKIDQQLFFMNSKIKLKIIYEDENILLINKPTGLSSQLSDDPYKDSVQKALLKYLYENNKYNPVSENTFVPSICNRLDTNTAGIIIAAKNNKSLQELNELIKERKVIKKYLCLVIGDIQPNEATLKHYHKKGENNLVIVSDIQKQGYKEMITKYKKIKFDGKYSLLDVELVTGRTHQIRAHFNFIGYPLVGETKYKSKLTNTDTRFKNQALVSYYVKFIINDENSSLHYLNNKEFKINDIWFKDLIKKNN